MAMDVEKVIREYIPQVLHMSLATSRDNKPWVCEVHFVYDPDLNLYFRTLASRRHSQDIESNPAVAGNIVTQHFLSQAVRGVYFEGQAKMVTDSAEREAAFQYFKDRLHANAAILEEAKKLDGHQFYKIVVDNFYLFDSYSSQPSQMYKLPWHGAQAAAEG